MLDRFAHIARQLYPASAWLGWGALLSLIGFVGLLLFAGAEQQARWLLPLLMLFLWLLSGWAFLASFIAVPDSSALPPSRWARFAYRLKRLWYGVLALLFVVTTVAVLLFSIRLLKVW